ncbi:Cytochrome c oxidase assembly protein cox11, mitochondrial [Lithohypha guttulata]|uniref:Cytochrome c oxidase assembly protein cox11, mitochondrial n=1 Tax=Lithohypha guttulata TaxID=1690604 RepID=A0AAN7YHS2_9EURO|nr:Cytochrome c oxidase assembly protein cox11, mitochondrial [Lithohypha guttulata]KAK5086669.1 Cytochrome c oxidase assembly protein cox11, mitochondrial [Lithohypha guttulata]
MAKPDLLSIPAEIRSIIYTTLFDDADLSLRITRYGAIDTSKWPLPIVRVCKLLRVEALHLLQEHNIWLLCENGVFPRKIHEKLPEWIYKRVRVIQMSRTAHAMFQFPLPSRSTFPKLESVIIDFDGFGRVEGTIDDSLEEHPRLRQPEHQHYQNSPYQAARSAAKEKNRTTMYYGASLIIGTVALSYGSVPLYKMICQQTGWSGQPVKAHENTSSDLPASERLKPMADHRRLRITFNGSVSDVLPWKFTPQQREVRVLPGETALAFYTATNKSEADIIGVATYSVTPGQVAPYFSKIQCFCFEEQKLNKGETVDMPVFFFIDPDFAKDPNMRGIDTITLSYTFFKARYDKNGVLTTIPGALMPA